MNQTQAIVEALRIIDLHIAATTGPVRDALIVKRAAEIEHHALSLALDADIKASAHQYGSAARVEAEAVVEASFKRLHQAGFDVAAAVAETQE